VQSWRAESIGGIIWAGDFNTDLYGWSTITGRGQTDLDHYDSAPRWSASHNSKGRVHKNGNATASICTEFDMYLADGYLSTAEHTWIRGEAASCIDHIIMDSTTRQRLQECQVWNSAEAEHCNALSDHRVLGATFHLPSTGIHDEIHENHAYMLIRNPTPFNVIWQALASQTPVALKSDPAEWNSVQWNSFLEHMETAANDNAHKWRPSLPDIPHIDDACTDFVAFILAAAARAAALTTKQQTDAMAAISALVADLGSRHCGNKLLSQLLALVLQEECLRFV
jgi:hypothetical protein